MKMILEKILDCIERFIEKHHKCENHEEVYSESYYTDPSGFTVIEGQETRCAICHKTVRKWGW